MENVDACNDLHAAVASAAHNRVLDLVAFVLIRLSRLHQLERLAPKTRKQIKAEVLCTHEGIARPLRPATVSWRGTACRRHLEALDSLTR